MQDAAGREGNTKAEVGRVVTRIRVVPRRVGVGAPEAGASRFEAGRWILPRRARRASIERLSLALGPFFADRHRDRHAM